MIGKLATTLILSALIASRAAIAATTLDVMIVFSDDVSLSTVQKLAVAARYQTALSVVYGGPGVTGQLGSNFKVEVWPLITPAMSYNAAEGGNAAALQWMIDENEEILPPSPLRFAREALGNPGADVILMVVPSTTDDDCGAAGYIPILAGTFHSETKAFGIVYLESVNPTCPEEIVIPHEIGHLLYAEHETDTNGDNVSPDPDNHATTSTSTGQKSLMWDGIHPQGTDFLSGNFATNTVPGWADNVKFMSNKSFEIVASYRKPPPTVPTTAEVWFNDCISSSIYSFTATWDSTNLNPGDYFEVEYMSGSGWTQWFEGAASCNPINSSFAEMSVRFRVVGDDEQTSPWIIKFVLGDCGGILF